MEFIPAVRELTGEEIDRHYTSIKNSRSVKNVMRVQGNRPLGWGREDDFNPQWTIGNIWRHFVIVVTEGMLLASSG